MGLGKRLKKLYESLNKEENVDEKVIAKPVEKLSEDIFNKSVFSFKNHFFIYQY